MRANREVTIRSCRLALTSIILFAITWYYQTPERAWALITVWFVMLEPNTVGGGYLKSLYRFAGTFLSALYGLIIIYTCGNNPVINIIAFLCGLVVYVECFIDTSKVYIAVIGTVTLTIVLLNHNDIQTAVLRTFNIFIGIAASMLMIKFFYPSYARDKLINIDIDCIVQLTIILEQILKEDAAEESIRTKCKTCEALLLNNFTNFNKNINDAKIETSNQPMFVETIRALHNRIRHLYRIIFVFINLVLDTQIQGQKDMIAETHQILYNLKTIEHKILNKSFEDIPGRLKRHEESEIIFKDSYIYYIVNDIYSEIMVLDKYVCEVIECRLEWEKG